MRLQISVTIDVTSIIILFRILTIFTSHTLVSCAHEQKANGHASFIGARWALSIGVATVANKKALFLTLVDRISRFDAH